jgi:hypothetical protein
LTRDPATWVSKSRPEEETVGRRRRRRSQEPARAVAPAEDAARRTWCSSLGEGAHEQEAAKSLQEPKRLVEAGSSRCGGWLSTGACCQNHGRVTRPQIKLKEGLKHCGLKERTVARGRVTPIDFFDHGGIHGLDEQRGEDRVWAASLANQDAPRPSSGR